MVRVHGRETEQSRLGALLREAGAGCGGALVVSGPTGIGKSALVDDAVLSALNATADVMVLRSAATHHEADMPFAGLHCLLWPVLDRVGGLPEHQVAALGGALGLNEGSTNRFLVATATLTLLSQLARDRLVVVVVDDAAWLDGPTAECLAYVGRRLGHDAVALVIVADRPGDGLVQLPVVTLGGLDEKAGSALLEERRPGLEPAMRARLVAAAEGHPLALLELPVPGVDHEVTDPLPVSDAIRGSFREELAGVGRSVFGLLLILAAHPGAPVEVVETAARKLNVAPAWADLMRTGLVETTGGAVRLRGRLIQSVVYDAATPAERRETHEALAAALDPERNATSRAWHRAAATTGPDEEVAALLDAAADRAVRQGAARGAVKALRRAAELSSSAASAAVRTARSARVQWEAGDVAGAQSSLVDAERAGGVRAAAVASEGLGGLIELVTGDCAQARRTLIRDHDAMAADDARPPDVADKVLGSGLRAEWTAGLVEDEGDEREPEILAWCRRAASRRPTSGAADPWSLPPALLAVSLGCEAAIYSAYSGALHASRDREMPSVAAVSLSELAVVDVASGRLREAHHRTVEALQIASRAGLSSVMGQCNASLAWLAALRGHRELAEQLASRTADLGRRHGARALVSTAQWHRGVAALLTDEVEQALALLAPLSERGSDVHHPTIAVLAATDTADAAVRAGAAVVVERQVAVLAAWRRRCGHPWICAAHDLVRGLSSERDAEELFRSALQTLVGVGRPLETARGELHFGEWLRRRRRRNDAQQRLTSAAEAFRRFGARALLARAEHGLELASPARRAFPQTSTAQLTEQEARVARLAAQGLSNQAIASRLIISPRTVGHHLSSVYAKLGIGSRTELTSARL